MWYFINLLIVTHNFNSRSNFNLKLFRLLNLTVQRHGRATRSESIAVRSKVRPRKYHVNMVVVEARRAADVRMQPIRMHFFCFVPCSRSQCSTAFRRVCHFLHVCPPGSLALPHNISCPHATDESCPRLSITVSKFLSNRRYKRKSLRRIINQNVRRLVKLNIKMKRKIDNKKNFLTKLLN